MKGIRCKASKPLTEDPKQSHLVQEGVEEDVEQPARRVEPGRDAARIPREEPRPPKPYAMVQGWGQNITNTLPWDEQQVGYSVCLLHTESQCHRRCRTEGCCSQAEHAQVLFVAS